MVRPLDGGGARSLRPLLLPFGAVARRAAAAAAAAITIGIGVFTSFANLAAERYTIASVLTTAYAKFIAMTGRRCVGRLLERGVALRGG